MVDYRQRPHLGLQSRASLRSAACHRKNDSCLGVNGEGRKLIGTKKE